MNSEDRAAQEKQILQEAQRQGRLATIGAYVKLSGPGWLQSAITLGGGSLAGSLYLGVIGGYQLLWLQPIMMLLGVLMLSVIGYVTLSTGEKPFQAINHHVNPVLGWSWLIAAMLANLVWAMPQFSLGTAAMQQNLFPSLDTSAGKYLCVIVLFLAGAGIVWFYDSGSKGVRIFEIILKTMVAIVVLSFFGVVAVMSFSQEGLPWSAILSGFIPDFSLLFHPADRLQEMVGQSSAPDYWREVILSSQRDRMVTAAATAVGINMTFLLPYSMLRKGWGRAHRGLATFDLSTGLFLPFLLATSCVVIAAATQFHGQFDQGLINPARATPATEKLIGSFQSSLAARVQHDLGAEAYAALSPQEQAVRLQALPEADKQLAATLISRDAFQLADSLENLTGNRAFSQFIFGIGVVGMAISTIIILMLINGFCVSEMLGGSMTGTIHRAGTILPGITGALGFLLLWGDSQARFWLAVPTSVFGMILLPIAYLTFFFMINSRALLKDALPAGRRRVILNLAMLVALLAATIGAGWSIWDKAGKKGVWAVTVLVLLAVVAHFTRRPSRTQP